MVPRTEVGLTATLADWLESGGRAIGQLQISACEGGWELRHVRDAETPADQLVLHAEPAAAREIALFDDAGGFRPLKAAPTLRRGWRLVLQDMKTLREALDFFYPAALGSWVAFARGEAQPVPLRETLNRQTGMYRVTAHLTDEQVRSVVRSTCEFATRCRRRITWELSSGTPLACLTPEKTNLAPGKEEMPVLCLEGCNWLVAKARAFLKREKEPTA